MASMPDNRMSASLVSDETLMAYADGELSPGEVEGLEALLARDATLRMRLAPFVVTREKLSDAFGGIGSLATSAVPVLEKTNATCGKRLTAFSTEDRKSVV